MKDKTKPKPKNLTEIAKYIKYNPLTGALYCCSRASSEYDRVIVPNELNIIATTVRGASLRIKADRLIWFITTGKQLNRNWTVFHKNLDELDNSLTNLQLISKKEHLALVEAMKNLSGDLKLVPHPTDMFSFVLSYKHRGRPTKEILHDLSIARRKFNKIQLRCIKLVSKYTISD
jgi:HNH endonuclease